MPDPRIQYVLDGATIVANQQSSADKELIRWARARGLYARIDRATRWGNPFRVTASAPREVVVIQYLHWIATQRELLRDLPQLRGKVLGCWCAPEACHGHVLLGLITNNGWLPIDIAPKDGTRILLFRQSAKPAVRIGFWDRDRLLFHRNPPPTWICAGSGHEFAPDQLPTHWRPIPDLPSSPTQSAG
ncbi:DUF4326 domain-containing protein [Tuwongella immobilis]|uniref:DUF4326 domain-containing protein n=1 Tax=Tuwongella immobilis TaxID=692036 RepID=A0A6C2YSU3_9BACT|nr:DUF4326 domain-containing protein [Tuwongella immobilis]VIP03952.1 Uncharacterized protein OS=Sinorhizobium fredii USDA 257 GN=USDA257_c46250 PE=4 SV=1: DUF4326 [Tuwongella immobilis]VTS05271.1 Uncharacterized protein OS=Sinorhizobium fredii USDA 257 GN=USDA257_c46250 PE=4 SV=1: DUF4326 [Tuwongella immobilis]